MPCCLPKQHFHPTLSPASLSQVNTWFLIARRQIRPLRRPLSLLYWATFGLFRLVLYPVLLPVIAHRMMSYPVWERMACVGAQALLILFNLVLLAFSLLNRQRRRGRGTSGAANDMCVAASSGGGKSQGGGGGKLGAPRVRN